MEEDQHDHHEIVEPGEDEEEGREPASCWQEGWRRQVEEEEDAGTPEDEVEDRSGY